VSKYVIIPFTSVGKVNFGDSRENTRTVLGEFTEFKKSKFSKNTTDDFKFCHVFYDLDNNVEAVEFFNDAEVIFKGKNLFSLNFAELKRFIGGSAHEDESGAIFPESGISAYAPDKDTVESILVYRRGYYDN